MDFGAVMFPTEYAIQPDELARALEERGFESLWVPEHTHIPASRKSRWPGGDTLPREYSCAYDPFIALMAAASATSISARALPAIKRNARVPRTSVSASFIIVFDNTPFAGQVAPAVNAFDDRAAVINYLIQIGDAS